MQKQYKLKTQDYDYYLKHWEDSLQSIDNIAVELESLILKMEKNHISLSQMEQEIDSKVKLLATLYSNYNSLPGREYVLKFKKVFEEYSKNIEQQKVKFNILYYLLNKINEIRNESFSDLPSMKHTEQTSPIAVSKNNILHTADYEYPLKWVAYIYDSSSFILQYKTLEIIDKHSDQIKIIDDGKTLKYNNKKYQISELFTADSRSIINYYLIKDNTLCLPAEKIKRKIFSRKDIFADKIRPLENSLYSKGFVRFSGTNYILL